MLDEKVKVVYTNQISFKKASAVAYSAKQYVLSVLRGKKGRLPTRVPSPTEAVTKAVPIAPYERIPAMPRRELRRWRLHVKHCIDEGAKLKLIGK